MNVLGRPLGAGEINRMTAVSNIVSMYKEREASDNWAAWDRMNEDKKKYLDEAYKLALEMGMVKKD